MTLGKNRKGKELGEGLSQRKDGLYSARYTDQLGVRKQKYFRTLPEARNWLAGMKEAPLPQRGFFVSTEMTVDNWFDFWTTHIVCDLAPNTIRNYRERYKHNVQPVIGQMRLVDVRPMHCKMVFNRMERSYAGSTIRQTYIAMGSMFRAAVMNDLITKHPMDGVRFNKPIRAVNDLRFLTVEEQKRFLEVARRSHNYHQYALILETGLRTGEMIGLTWDAIDWKKRTLTVNKTLEYRYTEKEWRAGPPKTVNSYRTIPLTNRACEILLEARKKWEDGKKSDLLETALPYMDGEPDGNNSFTCRIWYSSTGAPGNLPRTVPTTRTCISFAMKPASSGFACTPFAIPMPPGPSKAACSRRSCKSSWATGASRPPWIAMSM